MRNTDKKTVSLVLGQELIDRVDSVLIQLKNTNLLEKNTSFGLDKATLNKSALMRAAILAGLKVIEKECLK
jgi:hypothetical protein